MRMRYVYTVTQEIDDEYIDLAEAKAEMGTMADDGFHSYFEDDIHKHLALQVYDEKTNSWKIVKEEME